MFAFAVSVTAFAGASAITTVASDAPVVGDIDASDPIHRTTAYQEPKARVDLAAGGGEHGLTYEIVDQPQADDATIGEATVRGTEAALSIGSDAPAGEAEFTYRAVNSHGEESDIATVTFEVANRSPLTRDLTLTTERDAALDIWPYTRDAESGGPFPWTEKKNRITYSDPKHGTIEPFFGKNGGGAGFDAVDHKAVYVPDPGYVGSDSFEYTFTDVDGGRSTAQVAVDVVEPEPRGRGELRNVRYRCAPHMRSNGDGQADSEGRFDADLTTKVGRYLGGDLVFQIDAGMRLPRALEPGASYRLGRPTLDLTMQPGATELFGGAAVDGSNLDLDAVGFGQASVGAEVSASAMVRGTAREAVREVPIEGLATRRRSVGGPEVEDGLRLALAGSTESINAPRRGAVVVSLPRVFGLNLRLAPGLRGGEIDTVGMRCYAPGNEQLELARIAIAR